MNQYNLKFLDLQGRHNLLIDKYCAELRDQIYDSDFILGSGNNLFEEKISKLLGQEFLSCGNCTDALYLSLKYIFSKLPSNKREVIVSPMSYLASVSTIVLAEGIPHFVDIEESMNIDPYEIERAINERTAAIMVVHLGGIPANISEIEKIANKYGIEIIEDCAQAFLTKIDEKVVGTYGLSGCYSFHPLKIFGGCGDGGGITSKDKEFISYIKKARNHGHSSRDDVEFFSHNMRMDSLTARFLSVQLPYIDSEIIHRNNLREMYCKKFEDFGILNTFIGIPEVPSNARVSYNFAMFRFKHRDLLKTYLDSKGIESRVHYPKLLCDLSPFIKGENLAKMIDIHKAKNAVLEILSLPCSSHLNEKDICEISTKIAEFYSNKTI